MNLEYRIRLGPGAGVCFRMRLPFVFLLALGFATYSERVLAQSQLFVGRWEPPNWHRTGHKLGVILNISQKDGNLVGTVESHDPHSEHESEMLNPIDRGNVFTFEVNDDYVGRPLRFSMTLTKGGHRAQVQGAGGEMLLDFTSQGEPASDPAPT